MLKTAARADDDKSAARSRSLHASGDHLDGCAVDQRFVLTWQRDGVALGEPGGDFDASQILQRELNRLALQMAVDDAIDVRLGLINAQSIALQGQDSAMLRDDDCHADIYIGQQAQV